MEPREARVRSGFHTTVRADSSATHSVRLYLLAAPQPVGPIQQDGTASLENSLIRRKSVRVLALGATAPVPARMRLYCKLTCQTGNWTLRVTQSELALHSCLHGRKAQSCIKFANARLQLHCV